MGGVGWLQVGVQLVLHMPDEPGDPRAQFAEGPLHGCLHFSYIVLHVLAKLLERPVHLGGMTVQGVMIAAGRRHRACARLDTTVK